MEVNLLTRYNSLNSFRNLTDTLHRRTQPPTEDHPNAAALFFLRRFSKGFMVGFVGKFVVNVLPLLVRAKGDVKTIAKMLRTHTEKFIHDPIAHAAFLGSFVSIFESMIRLLLKGSAQALRQFRAAIAGGMAALSILWLPREVQVTVSLFFSVRALEIVAYHGVEKGYWPSIPFSDVIVMVLSSTEVLGGWLFRPQLLEPSYRRFLNHQGGKDVLVVEAYGKLLASKSSEDAGLISEPAKRAFGTAEFDDVLCEILHPGETCWPHFFSFFRKGFLRAMPVYIPVYLLPLVIFRWKTLINDPVKSLLKLAVNVGRSSLFLSTYCGSAWLLSCVSRRTFGLQGLIAGYLAGFSGSCLLFEKPHRRIELALYVLSQALRSSSNTAIHLSWIPNYKNFHIASFIVSMAIIMAAFVEAPWLMRPSYVRLLSFMFGSANKKIKAPPKEIEDENSLP